MTAPHTPRVWHYRDAGGNMADVVISQRPYVTFVEYSGSRRTTDGVEGFCGGKDFPTGSTEVWSYARRRGAVFKRDGYRIVAMTVGDRTILNRNGYPWVPWW
jgi:hypothetical protein